MPVAKTEISGCAVVVVNDFDFSGRFLGYEEIAVRRPANLARSFQSVVRVKRDCEAGGSHRQGAFRTRSRSAEIRCSRRGLRQIGDGDFAESAGL